ncbi:CotO family spore coat protein [Piscibacillus salipiscarius]|uniref:CotO family spore coat protein n=1 Tax=Piscibacillus salipiscarius TaxID=299480 RepID=A0ABW5QDY7_9BACI|nr:CotO family spore coat protein [Piscibacillus salipiscarius]
MEKRHIKPLLYIDQKHNPEPELTSQTFYYSAYQNTEEKRQEKEAQAASESSRSRFQSLSKSDKLDYILNLQETLPPLKCRLLTKEGALTGIIEEMKGDTIVFISRELPRRRTMNKEDLLDIQIVGF